MRLIFDDRYFANPCLTYEVKKKRKPFDANTFLNSYSSPHASFFPITEKLNDKNYELLKILIRLLETSKDPLILSVANHDIGEYVRCLVKCRVEHFN